VTHQSSVELASREQAATTLNDSNAVSCTVPVFTGNETVLFPGIRERIMTGIPGRPGNGNPGMHSLHTTWFALKIPENFWNLPEKNPEIPEMELWF